MTTDIIRWNDNSEAELFLAEERSFLDDKCFNHNDLGEAVIRSVLKDYFSSPYDTPEYESAETFLFSLSKEQRVLRDFWFETAGLKIERIMSMIHKADRLPAEERAKIKNRFFKPTKTIELPTISAELKQWNSDLWYF